MTLAIRPAGCGVSRDGGVAGRAHAEPRASISGGAIVWNFQLDEPAAAVATDKDIALEFDPNIP